MDPKILYRRMFGIEAPWHIADVELSEDSSSVHVTIGLGPSARLGCPECGKPASKHDHRERSWRHLDTCQLLTYVHARVPCVNCPEHGVLQVRVPWAEERSGFTAMFETLVIDWLRMAGKRAVVAMFRITWDEADGIEQRAVARGLQRREQTHPNHLSVDETSYAKRHEYVTVVSDPDAGTVLHVSDDRKTDSLREFYRSCSEDQLSAIRTVSMDMHQPYIRATSEFLGDEVICFDPFHVVQHLNNAVDKVRREEHKLMRQTGNMSLNKTRYLWLENPDNMTDARYEKLQDVCKLVNRTARAWASKEHASLILRYISRTFAKAAWHVWYNKAIRSRLKPLKQVAKLIRNHLDGIINAMAFRKNNARAESINARIQDIKRQAYGFRNRDRFRDMIYFLFGGLGMTPDALSTHTKW